MREAWLALTILFAASAAAEEWIQGRVLGLGWEPLPDVQIIVHPEGEDSSCAQVWTDVAGHFALRCPDADSACVLLARGHGLLASGSWRSGEGPVTLLLKRPGVLRGIVRDETGAPIAGAGVFPQYASPPAAITGADGRFELPEQAASFVSATVVAPGHEKGRVSADLREGQSKFVEVQLTRSEVVRGIVIDGVTSEPLPGVRFGLYDENTDALGRFEASSPKSAAGSGQSQFCLSFSRTGFAPEEVQVPQEARNHTWIVRLWPVATFKGSVLDPDGLPVAGAQLRFEGASERSGTTDSGGRFLFEDVVPGRVEHLMISHPLHPTLETPDFTVAPGAHVERDFAFARGATARMRVMAEGRPLPNASSRLARRGPTRWQWTLDAPRPVAADGSFVLEGIGASPVWFLVSAPGYAPVARPVPRPGEEPVVALEPGLVFEGELTGRTHGEVTISFVAPPPLNWLHEIRRAPLDARGRFRFEDLPALPLYATFEMADDDKVILKQLESSLAPPFGSRRYDGTRWPSTIRRHSR
jgi:hypothetical protein